MGLHGEVAGGGEAVDLGVRQQTVDLAQMCDATLLVIRQDTVLARDINDSIDVLNATNGKVIGCVLNDASGIRAGSTDKYGYGGHYGYGYGNYGGHYGK